MINITSYTRITSFDKLRVYAYSPGSEQIYLVGYSEENDGGQGVFYWDSSSAEADNGGTIVQVANQKAGRWKRVFSGAVNIRWFGANPSLADNTAQIQAAIIYTQTKFLALYIPPGIYLTGALTVLPLGDNIVAPPSKIMGDGLNSILKAKRNFTGTVLTMNNYSGVTLENFRISGNSTASCIDTSWFKTGPSVLNHYQNIWIEYFVNFGWKGTNDNDSTFAHIITRGAKTPATPGLYLEAGGGNMIINNCTCADSLMVLTAQSASVIGGYFRGIEFSRTQLGTNNMAFVGTQIYVNQTNRCCIFNNTQSKDGHYTYGLSFDSCYLIGNGAKGAGNLNVLNIGLVGTVQFQNCIFINSDTPGLQPFNLFGESCFSRSDQNAVVRLTGCAHSMITTPPAGFVFKQIDSYKSGVKTNDQEGISIYKKRIDLGALQANTWADIIPANILQNGVMYSILVAWNHNGTGAPFLISAAATIAGISSAGGGTKTINANTISHMMDQSDIALRYGSTAGKAGGAGNIQWSVNRNLVAGSYVTVLLTRLGGVNGY